MPEALTDRTVNDFFLEHGRFPRIGDDIPPWHYRGWLLAYVIDAHYWMGKMNVSFGDRWGYHLQIRDSMKLPDAPPPQIHFCRNSEYGAQAYRNLEKCVEIVWEESGAWSSVGELLKWLAYGCGVEKEFPNLTDKAQEKLYRTYDAKPALLAPYDYFGQLICDNKGRGRNWNPTGFYPTPHEVIECMSRIRMTMHDDDWRSLLVSKVMEPCLGTGRMLMHASNYSLRLYGCDIDPLVLLAAKVNAAFYVPWLAFPLPESLFDGCEDIEMQLEQVEIEIPGLVLAYDDRKKHKDQALLFLVN